MTGDPELVEALKQDYTSALISEADTAMLDYVAKLTREPWTVAEDDVQKLKAAGFDELAVLDICQVTSYYAYVNRMADGLGVELEEGNR